MARLILRVVPPTALAVLFLFPLSVSAFLLPSDFQVDQFIQNELAFRYREEPAVTKLLTFYQLDARYPFFDNVRLTFIGRIAYDTIYDLQDLSTINPFGNRFDPDLPQPTEVKHFFPRVRELYVDFFFEKVDLRIGRQIARWGVIEGFRITDELNPLDFSEFILREITDRYIPEFMVKADYYYLDTVWEGVWIPIPSFHRPAPRGSEWEEFQIPPNLEEPAKRIENGNVGTRISHRIGGWDVSASYLYAWDAFPAASRTIFGLAGSTATRDARFKPRYHRVHTLGATASKGVMGSVIKGEAAYVLGKVFGTEPIDLDGDGVSDIVELKRDYLKYALGWDVRLYGVDIFWQFSQQWIPNWDPGILQDRLETGASIFVQKNLMYDRLLLKFFVLYTVNNREALIRPRVEYRFTDRLKGAFGADIFEGDLGEPSNPDSFNFIGFFDLNDRVYTELRYSF